MDNTNLTLVFLMFVVVIVAQFIHARILSDGVIRLERAVWRLERLLVPGIAEALGQDDDDAMPWEPGDYVERPKIDERDFG